MSMPEPFALFDCSLARCATGRSCTNLRELLDAVRTVPDAVLEHHMLRSALEDHFELHEFPNDLAHWTWTALGDQALAEELSLVDPYRLASASALRGALAEVIEERLWGVNRIPWCRPGLELHLVRSRLIANDTGERFPTPTSLAEALPRWSPRSLYYHVHEAYRRTEGRSDDLAAWLETQLSEPTAVARMRSIDFYFLNLSQLRHELVEILRPFLPEDSSAGTVPR